LKEPIEVALSTYAHKKAYLEKPREVGRKLKEIFRDLLQDPEVRVLLFGSVPRGDYKPLSDLDVLVVSKKIEEEERAKLIVEAKEKLGDYFAPIEFHLVTPETFERWYKKFIDEWVEI
jgi:predicted nucleotidyltransferase